MEKFWFGQTKDNEQAQEFTMGWDSIKNDLVSLGLNNNRQIIELPMNMEYVQGKTASAPLSGGPATIESRFVGFIKNNIKIIVRVDEKTNNIKIEVHEITSRKNP